MYAVQEVPLSWGGGGGGGQHWLLGGSVLEMRGMGIAVEMGRHCSGGAGGPMQWRCGAPQQRTRLSLARASACPVRSQANARTPSVEDLLEADMIRVDKALSPHETVEGVLRLHAYESLSPRPQPPARLQPPPSPHAPRPGAGRGGGGCSTLALSHYNTTPTRWSHSLLVTAPTFHTWSPWPCLSASQISSELMVPCPPPPHCSPSPSGRGPYLSPKSIQKNTFILLIHGGVEGHGTGGRFEGGPPPPATRSP